MSDIDDTFLSRFDALVAAKRFFAWGSAPAQPAADADRYRRYLAAGRHAAMGYLARNVESRCDPRALMPGARSVLVFLRSYAWPAPPVPAGHARVAAYARGLDYHATIGRDLRDIAAALGPAFRTRVFVDTGPVLERYWARRAALASLGKNTTCLRRDAGSRFLIGVIVTDAPFPGAERAETDLCGSCERCLAACPTGALDAPYELDARRCLSYLTIEHRGPIPPPFRAAMGDVVFGCDRCQDACPHNAAEALRATEDLRPRPPFAAPSLADILALSEPAFRALAADRAVERATIEGLKRNALIVAANTGTTELLERFAAATTAGALEALARELRASR